MQATVSFNHEALPIVKSGMAMKKKALELNLRRYQTRLAAFETQYNMASEQFAQEFNAGELGDDAQWFEWEFVFEAFQETQRQLRLLASVGL